MNDQETIDAVERAAIPAMNRHRDALSLKWPDLYKVARSFDLGLAVGPARVRFEEGTAPVYVAR